MKRYFHQLVVMLLLFLAVLAFTPTVSQAQCPMCKGAAETSQQEGSDASNGINKGILYLFVMPYLLVGIIGYQWYRTKKRNENSG